MRAARDFVVRTLRAVRLLASDGRIPRPLRWLAVLGLLPIPGPLDEALLLLLAAILFLFHRGPLREAWLSAGEPRADGRSRGGGRASSPS